MVGVAIEKISKPTLGASPRNVTLVSLVQSAKAQDSLLVRFGDSVPTLPIPILVTLLGIVILVRLVQFLKAPSPILVTPSGIVILVRLVQPLKALFPMLVTLSPIVTLVRLVQPSKALKMMSTPLPIMMLVRLVQPLKAFSPISVTLSGIVMLVRLLQNMKAPLPILVTVLPSIVAGITSLPDALSSHPVMVTVPSLILYFKLGLRGTSSTGLVSATGSSGLTSVTGSLSPHPPKKQGQ